MQRIGRINLIFVMNIVTSRLAHGRVWPESDYARASLIQVKVYKSIVCD